MGGAAMNLDHLRYFAEVAHTQHFRSAADKLMITQPSLSHAISQLEAELGVNLFEKKGRNSILTKCGKEFLSYVEQSLTCLDSGIEKMKLRSRCCGGIDFAFLRSLGSDLAPEFIGSFMRAHPDQHVVFHCYPGMTTDLLHGLKDRKYDIVLCSRPPMLNDNDIEFINISRQELVLITPKGHPLSDHGEVDLTETSPYPFVAYSPKTALRPITDSLFQKYGIERRIAFEVEDDIAVAGFVSQGLGIGIVPRLRILNEYDVCIQKIKGESPIWGRSFDIAILKGVNLTPAARSFMDFILQRYALTKSMR